MIQADIRATFLDLLFWQNILHEVDPQTGHIHVNNSLYLDDLGEIDLPDDLTVDGHLFLNGTKITRLPRRLVVTQSLYANATRITALPQDLSVGEQMSLGNSPITTLPDNFHVPGTLNLRDTPIATLPRGLHVEGRLYLHGTRVLRLPPDLTVRGGIYPPMQLHDIVAFMEAYPDIADLVFPETQHERMQALSLLAPFPDLWTVVQAMGPTRRLCLMRDEDGTCCPSLETDTI